MITEQLQGYKQRLEGLKSKSTLAGVIAYGGFMEFIGTIALQALQKGDPALVQTAQYLSLIAMSGGTINNIISETTKVELNKELFSVELEAQQEKLRGLVRTLPQDAFENIWGVLRGVRDTAISTNERLGDEFESTYQIYAERAGESQEQLD